MISKGWAALAAAGIAVAAAPVAQDDALSRLRWLAGCWELRRANRVTLEGGCCPRAASRSGPAGR